MTDKITDQLLHRMTIGTYFAKAGIVKVALASLLSISILAQSVHAQEQEWWFDVEVILFKRNIDAANISEKFKQSRLEQPSSDLIDLLTPYLNPNVSYLRAGLPYCRVSNRLAAQKRYEKDFAFPLPVAKTIESPSPLQNRKQEKNQQTNIELAAGVYLPKPSINVEFIEWQVPSEFLCSYAEQIDASFSSTAIKLLQEVISNKSPSKQIKRVPEKINGIEWHQRRSAFLLPRLTTHMDDLYEKIKKQRDITPILHLNWRQEVKFGRDKGKTFRLFAGENFAHQFDANGFPLVDDTDSLFDGLHPPSDEFYVPEQELVGLTPEQRQRLKTRNNDTRTEVVTEDLFARIEFALADETPFNIDQVDAKTELQAANTDPAMLKEIWQLDGGITVYLRNIGRVPYLHIDSNLDFRQPMFDSNKAPQIAGTSDDFSKQDVIVGNNLQQPGHLKPNSLQPNFLHSVNFNQLRRVISKQVHYFDHPLFGMVVRINRYEWPNLEEEETSPR
jgi:hypothetical protein